MHFSLDHGKISESGIQGVHKYLREKHWELSGRIYVTVNVDLEGVATKKRSRD